MTANASPGHSAWRSSRDAPANALSTLMTATEISVLTALRSQAVPGHWLRMVEEVAELEADEQGQMFGEGLPIGLRLLCDR